MIIETATVVWGKEYINDFFNISLRSLLSGKNLEYIKDKKLIINVIFKEGEKIFVQSFLNEKKMIISMLFSTQIHFLKVINMSVILI